MPTDVSPPMRVKLSEEGRERLVRALREFLRDDLDVEVSGFQADRLVDFFARELGAPVYNQAIQDARAFLQQKLDDLEGEFYEPENS